MKRIFSKSCRIAAAIAAAALGLLAIAVARAPLPPGLDGPPPGAVELTDRNGQLLREVLEDEARYARPATRGEIPATLRLATLAAEDRRFFHHPGIDPIAIARAASDWFREGRVVSGASTITQQLVKIASGRLGRPTLAGKATEALQAIKLDLLWDKERILDAYLNRLDYGNLRIGCRAAARFYFDKPLADLSFAEASLLAALPRSPVRLNPLLHPGAAETAREAVLDRLLRNGWIDASSHIRAVGQPMSPGGRRRVFRTPHFADLALSRIGDRTGPVVTTIDLDLNRFVEARLRGRIVGLTPRRVTNGAAVVIDNRTGELLALVGSECYFAPGCGQVNAALAPRSAGSTLKPFTYLLALERGWTPASPLPDIPAEYVTETGLFRPENFDRTFSGPVRLRRALANSLNVPAVHLLQEIGGPAPLARALQRCGVTTLDRPPSDYGLGLTIGNGEVRLLELANAYACLARLGVYRPIRIFRDERNDPDGGRRVFGPAAAYLIAHILDDDIARTPAFGPDSILNIGFPVACKTGTSSNFRDNWAFGYTPEFTVGVWVGNFDGSPMGDVSGVTGAAPLLADIFRHLRATRGTIWYAQPPGIIAAQVHPATGKRLAGVSRSRGITEYFLADHPPAGESPRDYDVSGRVILPPQFADWLASTRPPGFAPPDAAGPASLAIVSPKSESLYFLDPDLPGSDQLRLRAIAPVPVTWRSATLPIERTGNETIARLAPGRHCLEAVNSVTGESCRAWINVERQ
ncbi:MAG TPA: penicillin-binding protein 1C [Verrucomicrobiae bacterium]|nr:penicillin-binding protein 1C [Verrucomicrobiae bacterium]